MDMEKRFIRTEQNTLGNERIINTMERVKKLGLMVQLMMEIGKKKYRMGRELKDGLMVINMKGIG